MGRDIQDYLNYNLYVLKDAIPYCKDYLEKTGLPFKIIENQSEVKTDSKNNIIFQLKKGRFLEPCPGTPKYICCGYYIISPVENCPFDCTYCILQAYFKDRNIKVYVNIEDMMKELERIKGKGIVRLGTGEFSDSLFLPVTDFYLERLLDFFSKNKDIFLELKTKSDKIPQLALNYSKKNLIFSFSLNSPSVWEREELRTSPVRDRIDLAKMLSEKGFYLSFHFDPIIEYQGWEKDYKETIDYLFDRVSEKQIVWISMGILRYIPALKDIAQKAHPHTEIFKHEFIMGLDGKKRYFRKTRVNIYRKMLDMIRGRARDVFVYLCMENEDVWKELFGVSMTTKKLKRLMDERVKS